MFPKSSKFSPVPAQQLSRQDPIDEGGEVDSVPLRKDSRTSVEKQPSERDRLLDPTTANREKEREKERFERNLALERERQIEMASSRSTTSEKYDTGLREEPALLAQRDLISTVLDMKVDVRLEMQRLNQRVGRIEELLNELLNRLSAESSEQSTPGVEQVPTVAISSAGALMVPSTSTASGGNGLGPILLRKRRSKARKAPMPPTSSPEQTHLLEGEDSQVTHSSEQKTQKREFL